jgi:hypothetical protein
MIGELLQRGAKRVVASDVQDSSINAAKKAFASEIAVCSICEFLMLPCL